MTSRWPEMMKKKTAAEYCDLSEPAFEREVAAGRLPIGVKFGGREHWRKSGLDKALDYLTGDAAVPTYRQKLHERAGHAV